MKIKVELEQEDIETITQLCIEDFDPNSENCERLILENMRFKNRVLQQAYTNDIDFDCVIALAIQRYFSQFKSLPDDYNIEVVSKTDIIKITNELENEFVDELITKYPNNSQKFWNVYKNIRNNA